MAGPADPVQQLERIIQGVVKRLEQPGLSEEKKTGLREHLLNLESRLSGALVSRAAQEDLQKTSLLEQQKLGLQIQLLQLRQGAVQPSSVGAEAYSTEAGAGDDFTASWLKQNLPPFGPTALWDSPAVLRQHLSEAIRLPAPDGLARALIKQHGELRHHLVPVGTLPEGSRPLNFSKQVFIALESKLGQGSEAYTWIATYTVMESMLSFIAAEQKPIAFKTSRNMVDASGATVAKFRPDFLCWVNSVLLFKGEEKAGCGQLNKAVAELTSKMSEAWLKGLGPSSEQPPSMLAYAAAGHEMRFFSIHKRADGTVSAEPISDIIDLSTAWGRIQVLTAACNIWRLLAGFSDSGVKAAFALGQTLNVSANSHVTLMPGYVRKRILNFEQDHAPYTSFELLRDLYRAVSELDDPSVIIQACGGGAGAAGPRLEGDTYTVDVAPVGVPCLGPPATEAEVARAVHGVLRGLAALHSKGFVHRDVRWVNVVRLPAEGRWLLIDLEHAGVEGCDCSRPPFPLRFWSDHTLDGGRYTAASDLRMVAEQLMDWARLGPRGRALQQQLMEGALTAAEAGKHDWFAELAPADQR